MIIPTNIKLKLTRRDTPPYFNVHIKALDTEYWPHDLLHQMWRMRHWQRLEETPTEGIYIVDGYKMKIPRIRDSTYRSPSYSQCLFRSYFRWQQEYAPPIQLTGKTVLDAGSGIGETTPLWLKLGATKIIGVDMNPEACRIYRLNADANGWDVKILNEPFKVAHMLLPWDYAKIDVEGGEECLLELDALPPKPMVFEIHSSALRKALSFKFGLRVTKKLPKDQYIMRNWI